MESIEKLRTLAAVGGPDDTTPAYVRQPFPIAALPVTLRGFVCDATQAMGVPPEAIATPALAVCATAIGNTCRVRLNDTWSEPSVLWAVTLMESGSLKTPAYNAAMAPLKTFQQEEEEHLAAAKKEYEAAHGRYESEKEFVESRTREGHPAPMPTEPVAPTARDWFTSDCTVEALALLFSHNARGLAFTRDELSGFFGSFGAYKGGRGGDESAYLEFYNAGSVKINRASGKRVYVHSAALSIFGTCQPSVFLRAIGADGHGTKNQVENGLAARFVIAAPAPKAKTWKIFQPYDDTRYHAMVAQLRDIPLVTDDQGRPAPVKIPLSEAAQATFAAFVNEHGKQTAAILSPALRYHFAKLEGVAARLALVLALSDVAALDADASPEIGEQYVLAGIALARWYGIEATRVYEAYESDADIERRELLDLIDAHGGIITPREMRRARRRWSDQAVAEMSLRLLAREGYGQLKVVPAGPAGGRPSFQFHASDRPGVSQALESAGVPEVPPGTDPAAQSTRPD